MNINRAGDFIMDPQKILDIAPFGVFPPTNGGSIRINSLNMRLSKEYDIFLFSQGLRSHEFRLSSKSWVTKINPNYTEYRFINIPSLFFTHLLSKMTIPPVFFNDILRFINPSSLKDRLETSDLIQVEHPWQFKYAFSNKNTTTPIIFVEHNVELCLQDQLLRSKFSKNFLQYVEKNEAFALDKSNAIFSVSNEDKDKLIEYYDVDKSKIYVVPNGVDTALFKPSTEKEKELLKQKFNLVGKKIVLFTGWAYQPNYEAVEEIIRISKELNDDNLVFLIVGKVGERFLYDNNNTLNNILFTGRVESVEPYYKLADIAINPMKSGSGSNLKMLEYLSSGLPIITTDVGARGLTLNNGDSIICSVEDFGANIEKLLYNEKLCKSIGSNGRNVVLEKYDWQKIGDEVSRIYKELI
ncbi:glycosyltransferase family 4 protein [Methanosarcina sp. KYL-1]|uniref:glycosyltransferase family 4 protein n=1 Tax=Methanosarcina sp. KYL-1 TaxID=2602068 RepID=UPI002101B086|nr:glycosyltransferase family 4 protein [Methanosarcina sp. KYL-1]MCQ1535094.1 glycosyltransferase family 4 protein [Methanosarcina sp. KYL-1]